MSLNIAGRGCSLSTHGLSSIHCPCQQRLWRKWIQNNLLACNYWKLDFARNHRWKETLRGGSRCSNPLRLSRGWQDKNYRCNHLATFITAGYVRPIHTKACIIVATGAAPGQYLLSPTQVLPRQQSTVGRRGRACAVLCWPPAYRDNDVVCHNTSSTMWLALVTSS